MKPTIRDALHHGAERLRSAGIDSPRLEARLLLAHALGTDAASLLREQNGVADTAHYDKLLSRRAACEPLALIVGHREFWSLDFAVSPATLIPRPESETLIAAALAAFGVGPRPDSSPPLAGGGWGEGSNPRIRPLPPTPSRKGTGWTLLPSKSDTAPPRRILDLGTGTGCLLLAALSEFPAAFGIGADRTPAAAALAARNSGMLGMANRAAFVAGDWAAALDGTFDLILCNPPYIATPDLGTLMPDVAHYEPATALDGGPDGYTAYRRIIPDLPRLLAPNGVAVLELGQGQVETVTELARQAGFTARAHRDLSGIDRALTLRRPNP
jgi:release factor glutamine methyltransferase